MSFTSAGALLTLTLTLLIHRHDDTQSILLLEDVLDDKACCCLPAVLFGSHAGRREPTCALFSGLLLWVVAVLQAAQP
jgi:hypothetical protein